MKKKLGVQREKIFNLLQDGDFWSPKITDVAIRTNSPTSTVHSILKKMLDQGRFEVTVKYVFNNTTEAKT